MKKRWLKRSFPLKRLKGLDRKHAIARMSKSKKSWYGKYEQKRDSSLPSSGDRCPDCGRPTEHWEPHHPAGRACELILIFVWICHDCHQRIHDNGTWARETGRLLPEFEGRRSTPDTLNYFSARLP